MKTRKNNDNSNKEVRDNKSKKNHLYFGSQYKKQKRTSLRNKTYPY